MSSKDTEFRGDTSPQSVQNPPSPGGSAGAVSSNEEDEVIGKGRSASAQEEEEELIPVPPPAPKNSISILAHKLWIGNLDKRLSE